jgi:hypothetical protein
MAVNSTHPDYDASLPAWLRARDVLAGEDAVKAGGEKYLPRLDAQTDEEFGNYVKRASFFNATARTAEAYLGLIFRRAPFVKLPENPSSLTRALGDFANDADMLGTTLTGYAKLVAGDVVGVGRGGVPVFRGFVFWQDFAERRRDQTDLVSWRVERERAVNSGIVRERRLRIEDLPPRAARILLEDR